MGVIQVQQGKVSRVRAIDSGPLERFFRFAVGRTQQGLHDAVELRRMLEPQIARLAAQRHTEADFSALSGILAQMEASLGDILAGSPRISPFIARSPPWRTTGSSCCR